MTIRTHSTWQADQRLLRTALSGDVTHAHVEAWLAGLDAALAQIPDGSDFKLLFDLHGYEPADLEAHKAMRDVIPTLLVTHGMRPAVKDLFPEAPEPAVTTTRARTCRAFANVHHDEEKMARYQQEAGKPNQRFFSDPAEAERWILSQP